MVFSVLESVAKIHERRSPRLGIAVDNCVCAVEKIADTHLHLRVVIYARCAADTRNSVRTHPQVTARIVLCPSIRFVTEIRHRREPFEEAKGRRGIQPYASAYR